jgi:hypothetical protein
MALTTLLSLIKFCSADCISVLDLPVRNTQLDVSTVDEVDPTPNS